MVDFRKTMLLLIVVAAMASVATAQVSRPPLQCVANAGVPPIVRAEGVAEQVGDLVLNCEGGTPTPAGQPVPKVNVQIFLNVNVTSRLLADPWSEALLLVGDPPPAAAPAVPRQLVCGDSAAPLGPDGTCTIISTGIPAQTYDGSAGRPNIFQGRQVGANSIVWLGVPFDPPETTRTIRITNIRAYANAARGTGLIPGQIIMWISVSGATSVPINNPQQTVAFVQDGLSFSLRDSGGGSYDRPADDTYRQCASANCAAFRLRFSENFGTAFKEWGSVNQNQPGTIYNTEAMLTNASWPSIAGRGDLSRAGRPTQATRLMARFENVPAGVRLFVTVLPVAVSPGGLSAQLVLTDSRGANPSEVGFGPFITGTSTSGVCSSWPAGWSPVYELELGAARTAIAVWEITSANPFQVSSVDFGVLIRYSAQTSQNLPEVGRVATVHGTYAPLTTVFTASATEPVPRFVALDGKVNAFNIVRCMTNLLWPYVTNRAGFDTGLVIANTSRDPFGTETQEGPCTIYHYGEDAPPSYDTYTIPAGAQAVWTLSSGGNYGTRPAPAFQGYIIARCNFLYAHGYAFISDVGASKLAQGYLALILDSGGVNRTGQSAEALDN